MRYQPEPEALFIEELLPTNYPSPNINIPKDKLISFNKSYKELVDWVSNLCGVNSNELCLMCMHQFEKRLQQLYNHHADCKIPTPESGDE